MRRMGWTELHNGGAQFELVEKGTGVRMDPPFSTLAYAHIAFGATKQQPLFFARMGSARQPTPPAVKKVEHHTVHKVMGDGRCMFRALVLGMATNRGMQLLPSEEEDEADQLRHAVRDVLCGNESKRRDYEEALIAVTVDESLKRYCKRISDPTFWGGEAELLVLSRMCKQPIVVYIRESEFKQASRWGTGYIPIAEYGGEFAKASTIWKGRKPVKLLYNGSNHYDLLI